MNRQILLEATLDGSHTLYVPQLDEHYHSTNGAIQESKHVFINAGLMACQKQGINLLEIGFGTGLNALLTLQGKSSHTIHYDAFELFPLPLDTIEQLNYPQILAQDADRFYKLHHADWDKNIELEAGFELHKIHSDFSLLNYKFERKYDLIYFDAFAPNKQPEMWSQSIFDKLFSLTEDEGILVTYCAKGSVRRMLQQAGYSVERLAGPLGKREMLRALRTSNF